VRYVPRYLFDALIRRPVIVDFAPPDLADLHPDRTDQATAPSVKPPTQETDDMDTANRFGGMTAAEACRNIAANQAAVESDGHQKWEITDAVRNSSHERVLLARGWEPFSAVNAAAQTIVLYRRRMPITITYPAGPTDG